MQRSVIKEVEAEYGLQFWDVVAGYAEDGHSITATAKILGYTHEHSLRRMHEKNRPDIKFAEGQSSLWAKDAREQRKGICTPAQAALLVRIREANPRYVWVEHDGIRDTIAGHSRRAGKQKNTIYKRIEHGMTLAQALAK